jgi:hypothetical protein
MKPAVFELREEHRYEVPFQIECDGETYAMKTTIVWHDGVSPFLIAGVLAGIALLAFLYVREVRPRLEPASLRGRLVIYDGPGDFQRITVPLKGRIRFQLEGVEASGDLTARVDGDRLVLPGLKTSAELYAEKSGKKNVMRLRKVRGDEVKLGETELGAAPAVLRRGSARFSVGGYHCRID